METCAECGKPIFMHEPSFYKKDPSGDIGKTYHSTCGDPLGIKAAVAAERRRCADIALAIDSGRGNEKEIAKAILSDR